jgi:hypothetical protein
MKQSSKVIAVDTESQNNADVGVVKNCFNLSVGRVFIALVCAVKRSRKSKHQREPVFTLHYGKVSHHRDEVFLSLHRAEQVA